MQWVADFVDNLQGELFAYTTLTVPNSSSQLWHSIFISLDNSVNLIWEYVIDTTSVTPCSCKSLPSDDSVHKQLYGKKGKKGVQ